MYSDKIFQFWSIIFFLLNDFVIICRGQSSLLIDGDCLDFQSFDYFRYSPYAEFDPSVGINGTECARICSISLLPHAGLVGNKYCLCAMDSEYQSIQKIPKVTSKLCDESDYYLRYFRGEPKSEIYELSIHLRKEIHLVEEDVFFDVVSRSTGNVEYSIDFGDGSNLTEWSPSNSFKHQYRLSGTFIVTVYVRLTDKTTIMIKQIKSLMIHYKVNNENLTVKCPNVVEPDDKADCNITIITGTQMQIKMDFGDGNFTGLINLPDIPMISIGINVPQENNQKLISFEKENQLNNLVMIVFPISKQLTLQAAIVAIEGYAVKSGRLLVHILRRICSDEQDCLGTVISCFEPSALCSSSKTCNNECKTFHKKSIKYQIIKTFSLTISEGIFYFKSQSFFKLFPEDLIAFRMWDAQLAFRKLRPKETPDYKIELSDESMTIFYSNKFQMIEDKKYYLRLIVSEPLIFTMSHNYIQNGRYPLKFMLKNEFDDNVISRINYISVQSTISKMRLTVKPINSAVGNKVDIMVQLSKGSNIQLSWHYGDGNQTNEHISRIGNSQKFLRSYYYNSPGIYHINITAANLQGNISAEHKIIVEHPVLKLWKLSTNSPVLLPDLVKFKITYPKENILPTNATFFIIFGDGQKYFWKIPEKNDKWNGEHEISHLYEKSGLYNIDVDISNVVSKMKRRFQVEVMRKIVGLTVKIKSIFPNQVFIDLNSIKYISLNATLNFHMTIDFGDIEYYLIKINNKFYKETTEPSLNVTFQESGIFNFTFYGYNHIQNLSDPFWEIVHVFETVRGLKVFDISNHTIDFETKYFLIDIENVGTNSCLLVDFGEPLKTENFYTFGDYENCQKLFSKINSVHNDTLIEKITMIKKYSKPKDYFITVTLANIISREEQKLKFTIIEVDCKPPTIKIKNQINDWKEAIQIWRSKPIQLYSKTFIDCNATFEANRFWNAYRLDEKTGHILSYVDLSELDSYDKSFLYVPAFYLKPDVYLFQFGINMTCPNTHPILPLTTSSSTYVKIIPSPIIALLTEGAQSRIVRGWGQRITLSPRKNSIDPDDYSNKKFEIKWYCRRLPDEIINNLLSDEHQNFSEPIYDRSNIDEEWSDDDNGGCFGQGPGRINLTTDDIEWNTTVFRKADETYEILIQLMPEDRAPSWGAIQLTILKSKPPSVIVKCQTESLCYPHYPIGQKINPVRVGLEGKCIESCDGKLTYRWNIFGMNNGTEEALNQAEKYIVGIDEPKIAIGVNFFQKYYPKFKDFSVRLGIINGNQLKGESDIFLHINQPPEGGECILKYKQIRVLLDRIVARCSMWIDPEAKPIEYYGFWIRNVQDGIVSYLMYGPDKRVQLILPYGNFTVGVDIRDKEGALTKVEMANISTILPTIEEYEKFINSKTLEKIDASGDQSLMNMMAQALSSLMNINFGSKLNSTTSTTTTITTTTTASFYDYMDENDMEREAQTKAQIVKSVSTMMNVDTLFSLEQIGSALTALTGKGKGVDNQAKEMIIKLLNKTISIATKLQVESPQQLLDFCRLAVGTMGGIVNRMSEQIVSGIVLPTDKSKGWNLDYNVGVPDVDDEPDYIMDSQTSIEEALKKAVVQAERQSAELQIRQMIELTINLVLAILRNIVVGEEPIEFVTPSGLVLTIAMYPRGSISNKVIKHEDSTYIFPHVCDILMKEICFGNETLGLLAVSWPSILESYGNSVDLLSQDTKTLQLLIINETLNILDVHNMTESFGIIVPRKNALQIDMEETQSLHVVPQLKFYESMIYHQIMIEKADSALIIEIEPSNQRAEILIYIKYREKPLFDYFDILVPLRVIKTINNGVYNIFLSNEIIKNRTGFFYVGVVEVDKEELIRSNEGYILDEIIINEKNDINYTITNYTLPGALREYSMNYSMRIFTSGCYFFDYHRKKWSSEGCIVESANYEMTHCKCNHLTSFGSGFFVSPNLIDFSYVFANAGFVDNITIYMTIVITLSIYSILLVWARKNDKEDLLKIGSTPLPDNDPASKYLYEIIVYTGEKDESATDSKVQFILSGEDEETSIRTLMDPSRKIFRKGDTNSFLMATPKKLGPLNYIRIWHDNSGKGKFKSWFLSFIIVKDIQTGEKFEFICNKWFAVEKDDGSVDRLLPVASQEEATQFSHLFYQATQKNLADGHLWFSIFMRPPQNRFTRVQRVSCCMALLYLSMLVNAMWYQRVPSKPNGSSLEFGPLSLSPEQIGVGFMSNIIVFPITFLIIICFRKARLRKLRPSHITEALKKQKIYIEQTNTKLINQKRNDLNLNNHRIRKKESKRFTLPHYFRYFGWALCAISIATSIFFLWAYGIQFGDEKTRKWITSLIISFFASILVTQPIKIFLTAIILATIFKSPDLNIDDTEEDEDDIDWTLLEQTEQINQKNLIRSSMYRPPNMSILEKLKIQRLKEIKIIIILKDIFSYLCFLWILTVIGYGNRDPAAYLMKETLVKTIIEDSMHNINFMNIKTSEDLWHWINKTLISNLLIDDWYNGYKPLGLRGFMNDRVNRIMGYGILRQIRVKPNICKPEIHLQKVINKCQAFSNIIYEDQMSYLPGWRDPLENSYVNESIPRSKYGLLNPSKSLKDEWNYRSATELDGFSFIGKLDAYSGGGYVIPLKGSHQELRTRIKNLQNWIDERTRAVITEFSVYNAQANLFGIISCVNEFQPGGGIVPNYRIDIVRLMRHHQSFGLFVIVCELIYLIFIIYFTIRELKFWSQQGRIYLQSYWNWVELFIIILSYCAIGLYIYRIILTNRILSIFHESHGNGYVKLQYVSIVDELFGYLLAFIVFVTILKFIKLLRFNKRMGILYSTLAQCSKDLKSFSIVFCIVFFAFVQMFYVLFGVTMKEYSSLINTAETTFGMVTGKFDFDSMVIAAPILGPIVFFVFVLCTSIILVNIFLTLIISAFETVKREVMKQNNEYEIIDFILKKFKSFLGIYTFPIIFEAEIDEKEKELKLVEEQIELLPVKIDQLLNFINNTGKQNTNKNIHSNELTTLDVLQMNKSIPDKIKSDSTKKKNRKRLNKETVENNEMQKITFLDWKKIED